MRNDLLWGLFLLLTVSASAQSDTTLWNAATFSGMEFRLIGPALESGRIADIAIHPHDQNTWYVAVGSGGVWKTENAGTTWTPLFDGQKSYSIGCVTIDPTNPNTIWVGSGENVGGRHVGYGDGIYKSTNSGKSWKNMGLKESQHISEIIVHPNDPNTIWVAAQGPLWNKGGERGLYKSTDGGETWDRTLGNDEWTGVTDIELDPRDPDRVYAATWDRHRNVAAYMGGGPGTGIHRSEDGGTTWTALKEGLPKSNMGKLGIAISPQRPDVIYAAIELDRRKGGVFKSTDRGSTWKKMSDEVAGGTGPHYYQELYACPHNFDRIYLMNVRMRVSEDGGKTFRTVKHQNQHSDHHALVFRADDPDYLLTGTDGGIYETFDLAENWRFVENLPLTQFYKIAVDDAEPFYRVYGGTQDNHTVSGPSRTDKINGIMNSDWRVVNGGDGHQPATEPGNPDVVYAQSQQGYLNRIDMKTGEVMSVRPQPEEGEERLRFNWDAPILVSPHDPARIYFGSQKLFRSDDRGDSWTTISGDLTRNLSRIEQPLMGKKQSYDNSWDLYAMSQFSTITSISESPVQPDLIYVGTDDGLIQITEDGGSTWRQIDVEDLPGVPKMSYVNDIKADLHDANKVYIALDAHKYGDFEPYLLVSKDKGKSWRSITDGIPKRTLVWRIVQDHVDRDLLFLGTEFGIYFSRNGGKNWTRMKGFKPNISVRDLTIHKRENDLIAGTFGRSIYILDDYTALRNINDETLGSEAVLFPIKDAWWYIARSHLSFGEGAGFQGASHWVSPNPQVGASMTFYLKEGLKTKAKARKEKEKEATKAGEDIEFPGWEALEAEVREESPKVFITIKDAEGNIVQRLDVPATKGMHRVTWNMRYPSTRVISFGAKSPKKPPSGLMAAPGTYTATLNKRVDGIVTALSQPQEFELKPLYEPTLKGAPTKEAAAFWRRYEKNARGVYDLYKRHDVALKTVNAMDLALKRSSAEPGDLDNRIFMTKGSLNDMDVRLRGQKSQNQIGAKRQPMTLSDRLYSVSSSISRSTYGPTSTNLKVMDIVEKRLSEELLELGSLENELDELRKALRAAGAPAVEGR